MRSTGVEHRISLNGSDIVELGESWGEIPVVAQDSRQVDQQEGETIMTLEDMDRDQLAEYELRRLNFSDDNWRIGHTESPKGLHAERFSTSLTPMS